MPSRTLFGVHVILTGVGIQALFVLYKWLPTAKTGDGQMRVPRFSYVVYVYYENRPDFRVSVGNLVTNQYEV